MYINTVSTYTNSNNNLKPIFMSNHKLMASQLVNNLQLRDAKIRAFLLEIIRKNESFSMREIAEKLDLTTNKLQKRIYQIADLKEKWDKVMQITAQKSNDINNKIKLILEEAVQKQIPISAQDIAKMVGINDVACRQRIRLDSELKELFSRRNEKPRSVKSSDALVLEEKIKQFLEKAVQNNELVSSNDLSERFGLKTSQIRDRIKRNPILKELWNKLEHFKIPKKKQKDKDNDNKIIKVLEDAENQGKYLSVKDVASLTGLSINVCMHKFSNNAEIKKKWQKVNKASNSMQNNFAKIRNALISAIKTKEYMTIADIGKLIGMNPDSVSSRFSYSSELKELWMQVKENNKKCSKVSERIKAAKQKNENIMTQEESKEVNELLKLTIETAIANNTPLNTATISKNLGIPEREVSRRANLPEIKPLWEKCKQIAVIKNEEKIDKIAEYFENAVKTKQVVTIAEAAKKFNIGEKSFVRFVYTTPKLAELWNQIAHKGGKVKNLKTTEENRKIIQIMQQAAEQNIPLLLEDVAKQVGITIEALKGRFDIYPQVRDAWNKVTRKKVYIEPTESVEKTEKIKIALQKRIAEKKAFMLLDIADEVNMDISALYLKVRRTPILSELWQSAEKSFVKDSSLKINERIRNILLDAIEKGEFLNNREIAKRAGVTYDICTQRIQRYEELSKLTEQVRDIKKILYKQEITTSIRECD